MLNHDTLPLIRVLLVCRYTLQQQALSLLIEASGDIAVVARTACPNQAVQLTLSHNPDVVLLELDSGDDPNIIQMLTALPIEPKILVLTANQDCEAHSLMIRLGAIGIVSKNDSDQILLKAIRCINLGQLWLDRNSTAAAFRRLRGVEPQQAPDQATQRFISLSKRERQVAQAIAQGLDTHKIANTFYISEKTVRNHLSVIYDKLDVSSRLELALLVGKRDLVH
jgi:DNA-binding NarL/FixJ family response regulator